MAQKMFHGTAFYAVRSRDTGTFGGRAPRATIKIYRSSDAGTAAHTISDRVEMVGFEALMRSCGDNRAAKDRLMAGYLGGGVNEGRDEG